MKCGSFLLCNENPRLYRGFQKSFSDNEKNNSFCYNKNAVWQLQKNQKEVIKVNHTNSLIHTRWNCKYHIVFAPKYRRKVFLQEKRLEVGKILRMLCEWKKVKSAETEVRGDHFHMLVKVSPKVSISGFTGYLKGKISVMIYEKFPE